MKVQFVSPTDKTLLDTEMESLPVRGDMLVIDKIVFECSNVSHVFASTGRGGSFTYVAVVRVNPV